MVFDFSYGVIRRLRIRGTKKKKKILLELAFEQWIVYFSRPVIEQWIVHTSRCQAISLHQIKKINMPIAFFRRNARQVVEQWTIAQICS
jgi:hypothetical protein